MKPSPISSQEATSKFPIGVFDSGLGGLTIVKALHELLPGEEVIYFGDTAHLPYGEKSPELIREYAANITRFLMEKQVKAIVIACNTASAVAGDVVRQLAGELPVFNVIEPAVNLALSLSKNKHLGVIGTKTTINSGIYRKTILKADPSASVIEKATPLLVPLIEEGWLHNTISREVIEAYLSDTGFFNIDTLILGCTHYPLVREEVQHYFATNFTTPVEVIDSSLAVAARVKDFLQDQQLFRPASLAPQHEYFASDFSQNFEDSAKLFLQKAVTFPKVDPH